jgi:hypothetical protein
MGVCITKPGEVLQSVVVERSCSAGDQNGGEVQSQPEDFVHPVISVDPPEDFHPHIPLTVQEEECRKIVRSLSVSDDSYKNLMADLEDKGTLSIIRSKVHSIPAHHSTSVSGLVKSLLSDSSKFLQLLTGQFCTTVAKAFAIYLWIASNIPNTQDWNHLLKGWRGLSSDYASLFNALCVEAGLNVEEIKGHLRGWRTLTGHQFYPNEYNYHSWNVVSSY